MIRDLIKSMLRITDTGSSMVDCVKYPVKCTDGYAGNSLLEKNILFCIKSDRSFGNEIEAASQTDSFNYKVLKIKDIEEIESISEENSVLGTYDKIINILEFDAKDYALINHSDFNNNDMLYMVYRLLQVEATYMINNSGDGIATALIGNRNSTGILDETICNFLKGLGLPLAKHRIICNSLFATDEVPLADIVGTLVFLISKYGYELNGEMLKLGN